MLNTLGILWLQVRHLKLTCFPLDSLSASLSTSQLIGLQEPQPPMLSKGNGGPHAAGGTVTPGDFPAERGGDGKRTGVQ